MPLTNGANTGRPRILMVGRTRYTVPLPDWLARKFDALERQLDYRVIASVDERAPGSTTHERFRLLEPSRIKLFDGVLFYLRLPFHVRRQIIDFRPRRDHGGEPLLCCSVARRAGMDAWSTAAGHRRDPRRLAHGDAPVRLAVEARAVTARGRRRPDRPPPRRRRARSLQLHGGPRGGIRGIPVTASFVAYVDLSAFTANPVVPLPEQPTALFVGMLEAYKNIDGLVAAWRLVMRDLPDARLVIVGKGARSDRSTISSPSFPTTSSTSSIAARAGRREDGCCDVPAAPVSLRRAPTRRDRGVRTWPGAGREPRGRHSGRRPRRGGGAPRRDRRRRGASSGTRSRPLRPRAGGEARTQCSGAAAACGGPLRRSTRRTSARSSTRRSGTQGRYRASGPAFSSSRRPSGPRLLRGPTRPSTPSARRSTTA